MPPVTSIREPSYALAVRGPRRPARMLTALGRSCAGVGGAGCSPASTLAKEPNGSELLPQLNNDDAQSGGSVSPDGGSSNAADGYGVFQLRAMQRIIELIPDPSSGVAQLSCAA